MAIDGYMFFKPYKADYMKSESQVDFTDTATLATDSSAGADFKAAAGAKALFEINDFSFDIEQTLNIGSQSSGSGAGRVTFNPFSITRKIDKASPTLFQMSCAGTPFETVSLGLRKATGGMTGGSIFLRFDFKLVAVKTISWSYDDESPIEVVTFEYGGLQMRYAPQKTDGSLDTPIPGGWNRVKNVSGIAGSW